MTRIFLATLLTVLPASSSELSCLPVTPQDAFLAAAASPDRHIVVLGRIEFNPALLPHRPEGPAPLGEFARTFHASFTGFSLTQQGFTARFVREIELKVTCLGASCGQIEPGDEILAFMRRDGASWHLDVGPCPALFFTSPGADTIAAVEGCFRGGPCTPGQP